MHIFIATLVAVALGFAAMRLYVTTSDGNLVAGFAAGALLWVAIYIFVLAVFS